MAICPYCKKEIDVSDLITTEIPKKAFKFKKEMYSCPYCKSILGFASIG